MLMILRVENLVMVAYLYSAWGLRGGSDCLLEMAGTGAVFGVLPVARFSAPPPIVFAGAGMSNRTLSMSDALGTVIFFSS